MKLKDAMPIYQRYRQQLVDQTRSLVKQRDAAVSFRIYYNNANK